MDLLLHVDRDRSTPLHIQVYDALRDAILDGRLPEGARMPSSRSLAGDLGLSRFTVLDAVNRLLDEGFVEGRHGSGTFVTARLNRPAVERPRVDVDAESRHWSEWSDRLAAMDPAVDPAEEAEIDFRHALPDLGSFPHAIWRRLMLRESNAISLATRYYGPAAGSLELRAALAGYLNRSRLIPCGPEQIVITTSSQEALGLIARIWLNPGDVVAFEEPGYPRARRTLALAGARIVPIEVDHDGLCVGQLERRAANARLVFVTPSHHYPSGAVLSLARRLELIEWARARGALVIEDDYNSEFRFGARPVPALAGIDATTPGIGSVVYIGTLSKVLFPSLRLGYVVVPPGMAERTAAAKDATNRNAPYLEQAVVAAFIREGHFERHLGRVRRLYAERRTILTEILAEELAGRARLHPAANAAGLHLLAALELTIPADELLRRCRIAGVHFDAATACYSQGAPREPHLLIGFASLPGDRMREGVGRLAAILDEWSREAARAGYDRSDENTAIQDGC